MKIVAVATLAALLLACTAQPPEPDCSDGGKAKLAAGVDAYNRGAVAPAFENLRAAAACGNSDAQVNLGYMYARGQGTPADQKEALRLYELSAAQGNGEGMNAVGYKYVYGTGVTIDLNTGVRWYCKAIERGNPRALNNLALLYSEGRGVPRDVEAARDLWMQSAARQHAIGLYNLAISYLDGPGEKDPERGTKLLLEAALRGQGQAQKILRSRGYTGPFPPVWDEAATMTIQPPQPPPGHAPICARFDRISSRG